MIPKTPEKRFYRRLDFELLVELKLQDLSICGKTMNISCGGMFLPLSDETLHPDAALTALISLPDTPKTIKLAGAVSRVEAGAARDGVAVRFSELYNDNLLLIDRFIKARLSN